MGLAGARVSDQQDIFFLADVLASIQPERALPP